jgi:hypothetical protein
MTHSPTRTRIPSARHPPRSKRYASSHTEGPPRVSRVARRVVEERVFRGAGARTCDRSAGRSAAAADDHPDVIGRSVHALLDEFSVEVACDNAPKMPIWEAREHVAGRPRPDGLRAYAYAETRIEARQRMELEMAQRRPALPTELRKRLDAIVTDDAQEIPQDDAPELSESSVRITGLD